MREPLDARDRWIDTLTQVTTPKERKPRGEVRVGDVLPDFKPGEISCFCGATSKQGYFYSCDSNGWPVDPSDRAVIRRKGRRDVAGDLLWDGASVVCSNCLTIFDSSLGTVTGFGTPPEFVNKPKPSQRVSEEERRDHRREGPLTKVRRLLGREPQEDKLDG